MRRDRRAAAPPPRRRAAARDALAALRRRVRREPAGARRASRCWSLIVVVAIAAPLDRAAEPLRPRAARRHGRAAAAGRASAATGKHLLARHRRPGPRHALGHLLRPAHLACRRRGERASSRWPSASSLGLAAAYFGGRVDAVIMRIVDIQLSFPAILVALILLAILGQGVDKIIIALVVGAVGLLRAHRARPRRWSSGGRSTSRRRRCLALSQPRIVFRHLLPNCLPPLIVVATVQVAHAIALEATLSFLGLGVPITEPSLGLLIANGFEYLLSGKYWISFYPGHRAAGDHRRDQPRRRPAARRAQPEAEAMTRAAARGRGPAHALLHQGGRGEGGRRRDLPRRARARSSGWSASRARASR